MCQISKAVVSGTPSTPHEFPLELPNTGGLREDYRRRGSPAPTVIVPSPQPPVSPRPVQGDTSREAAAPPSVFTERDLLERAYSTSVRVGDPSVGTSGSGVIIGKDGDTYYVVTNAHVTDHLDPGNETIRTSDGRVWAARLEYRSDKNDLSVMAFSTGDTGASYNIAKLAERDPQEGEWSLIIGFPASPERFRGTGFIDREAGAGYVVAQIGPSLGNLDVNGRAGYLTTIESGRTVHGMSGGGMFNQDGEVSGIHGRKISFSFGPGGIPPEEQNRAFGIPARLAREELRPYLLQQ
jgi:S1-C subfamily serine protease